MAQFVDFGFSQQVWNDLVSFFGGNEIGAAAMMGNLWHESGIVPYRLQGDFTTGFTRSIEYTADVDSKTISEYDFVHNGPNGGGYGLAQWTYYTRKQALYSLWESGGYSSIGSLDLALAMLHNELNGSFLSTKTVCSNATDIYNATVYVLQHFENPADQSQAVKNDRTETAQQIYDTYSGGQPPVGTYRVTVTVDGRGSASATPTQAQAGTTITLTQTPETGFEFIGFEVITGSVIIDSNNQFVMPSQNVVILAKFTGGDEGRKSKMPVWMMLGRRKRGLIW